MQQMIKEFTLLALKYKRNSVTDLYNYYLTTLTDEQINEIQEYFLLFIRCAETAREASEEMQNLIKKY